eukprot:2895504-Karenia_brevis.AAC.1
MAHMTLPFLERDTPRWYGSVLQSSSKKDMPLFPLRAHCHTTLKGASFNGEMPQGSTDCAQRWS